LSIQWVSKTSRLNVQCYRSLNLLAHAQLEELEVGSRCGGHGVCGGDRVLICKGRSELSPVTEAETKHLTREELEQGYRLACQAWPQGDDLEFEVESSED
jgi:ferredoxin